MIARFQAEEPTGSGVGQLEKLVRDYYYYHPGKKRWRYPADAALGSKG